MNNPTNSPSTGFLRLPQVLELIPVSRASWWAGIKSGKYPQGVKLSERITAWRRQDIDALIARLSKQA
jgi:predicted DNA-binding transcriptional regulator AlpA